MTAVWMFPAAVVYLAGWFVTARVLLRWHLTREVCAHGKPIAECRRERDEDRRFDSRFLHSVSCPTTNGERAGRDGWDLVIPSLAALVWPLVLLPALVSVSVPATAGELRQRNRDLEAEVDRLERAAR